MDLLFRKLDFVIFVVWSALIADLQTVAWSRKYCLGPAEIAIFVCLILFKDGRHRMGGRRVNPRFHLFVSNPNQGNEEAGSKFLCVTSGME